MPPSHTFSRLPLDNLIRGFGAEFYGPDAIPYVSQQKGKLVVCRKASPFLFSSPFLHHNSRRRKGITSYCITSANALLCDNAKSYCDIKK